jgi:hypothetical protein
MASCTTEQRCVYTLRSILNFKMSCKCKEITDVLTKCGTPSRTCVMGFGRWNSFPWTSLCCFLHTWHGFITPCYLLTSKTRLRLSNTEPASWYFLTMRQTVKQSLYGPGQTLRALGGWGRLYPPGDTFLLQAESGMIKATKNLKDQMGKSKPRCASL